MINKQWQCPRCYRNGVDVTVTEHRDMYGTGDSPTEYEVFTSCCYADAVDVNTYCNCGGEVYDEGLCFECYEAAAEREDGLLENILQR